MAFRLIQGVEVADLGGIETAFSQHDGCLDSTVSAELIAPLLKECLELLEEPHFFYLELPCTEEKEKELRRSKSDPLHFDVYYLDNCTREVSLAILDRYGELLVNDGVCCFGFGSHKTGEEIGVLLYQRVLIHGGDRFKAAFERVGIKETEDLRLMWDNFTPETPGACMSVEIEGEKVYDLPELLKDAGMYFAETREE
ncbi:MAG: hypothetical protein IKO44_00990 [Ruminococcus sp.]|nr:hypothetical protein [Ruminococcus sp.]